MSVEERAEYQRVERHAIFQQDREDFAELSEEPICRSCGCSQSLACEDGCGWASVEGFLLCTGCDGELSEGSVLRQPYPEAITAAAPFRLRDVLDRYGRGWVAWASPLDVSDYLVQWPAQHGHTVVAVP